MSDNSNPEAPSVEELQAELERLKYRSRYRNAFFSTVNVLIAAAAVAILAATLWFPVLQIYGTSMEPTLDDGNIVVSLRTGTMKQGDIVAFYYNNNILVKRMIAGPGDWVDIDDNGNVYINDIRLDEPYIDEPALGETNIELPYQVPENRYFLMGDQRKTSIDSRNTAVGCVAEEQIVGRLVFRVWPLKEFGRIQ